jgi:HSP20 family protein
MGDRPKHFSVFFGQMGATVETLWRPAVDVYRTPDRGWLLKFDLAGVRRDDTQVRVNGCRISVSGVRKDYLIEEGCSYYSMEIAYNRFERTIELPCDVESARWTMDYRDGILLVRLESVRLESVRLESES